MSELISRYTAAKSRILNAEFSRMNDRQRQAVFATEGAVLILAGAGSGKTTVLINRAANLLRYGKAAQTDRIPAGLTESDVLFLEGYTPSAEHTEEERNRATRLIANDPPLPWQLMAITFTNKAAGELKQRLCDMLGDQGNEVWAMTFHSSCSRILRRYADRLGYTNSFAIYDTDDQKRVLKGVMNELNIDDKTIQPKWVMGEISRAKDSLEDWEDYADRVGSGDFRTTAAAKIYRQYQKKLADSNAMDFDDLLFNTVRLFEENEDVLEYYQRRFRYIMVDEYQDTNHAQYRLISLLASGHGNLCVVGDDDQSIYKFRGATIENILGFEKDYRNARVIRLEQNYRSTQTILDAANSVIRNNQGRHSKELWTQNGKGEKVTVYTAADERAEAKFIAETVTSHAAAGGKYSDCAVLYRASSLSSAVENHLMRAGIPYRVVAGRKFYDRKEIRDALAYLNVINNPSDEVRLTRIVNEPKRGIGDRTIEQAAQIASGLGIPLFEVLESAEQYAAISRAAKNLKPFCAMIREFADMAYDPELRLGDLLNEVLERTGYFNALRASDDNAEERIENLRELASTMTRYQEEQGEEATLGGYLEDVALITDIDAYDQSTDCVSLMTLHAAKGLEFPVVFIPGAEDGIFPNMISMMDPAELEEDRRLAYVGITRAKKKLYFTHARMRMLYGKTQVNPLSRYVKEIDPSLIDAQGGEQAKPLQSSDRGAYQSSYQRPAASAASAAARDTGTFTGTAQKSASFKPGDRVKHRVFGEGEVLTASAMGGDTLLEINFAKVGSKKLMANFAGLKKL